MSTSNFERLCRQLEAWDAYPGAMLVYVDIRQMRSINQWAQPSTGDRIIERTLETMRAWAGLSGIAARLWSNEFVAAKAIDHGQTAIDECHKPRDALYAIRYPSTHGERQTRVPIGLTTANGRAQGRERGE